MTDRQQLGITRLPTPPVITIASRCSVGAGVRMSGVATPASGVSPFAASDMLAFPFLLTDRITAVNKAFWVNGSSVGGNTAMAIYDADFNKLAQTASTANSGASVPQAAAFSGGAVKLGPGLYYCAIAHDSATTNHFFRWSIATFGASVWKAYGCWLQASVTLATLPGPATPAACSNIAFPLCGLITRSGFDV